MVLRWLGWIARPSREAAAALPELRRHEDALFLGRTSAGVMQLRGNGTLALTQDSLAFFQWVPRRELAIPLVDVVRVDTARSHLGKTIGYELLRVTWRSNGAEDSAAWYVHDLAGWLNACAAEEG